MKGKIAVFSNGYNDESLNEILSGIRKVAKQKDVDVFLFINYSMFNEVPGNHIGEMNIYNLPHPEDFDGWIICSAMLNSHETILDLRDKAFDFNTPTVSLGLEVEGLDTILIDNECGTAELVSHLVEKHKCQDFVFVTGARENADSEKRLLTTINTLRNYGIILPEKNIYYGDWSQETAAAICERIISDRDHLPDAIVCANDNTALAICSTLNEHGYEVPKSVIVTGFDYSTNAQIYYPSISTVSQNFDKIGEAAASHLFEIIEGKSSSNSVYVKTSFIPCESCGCESENSSAVRKRFCQRDFFTYIADNSSEWHLDTISDGLSNCSKLEDIFRTTEQVFDYARDYEGDSFSIVLDSGYIDSIRNGTNPTRIEGYSEEMDVLYCVDEGMVHRVTSFTSRELVPDYIKRKGESNLYIFLPLHIKEYVYGYLIFKNQTSGLMNRSFRNYINSFSQILDRLKQNLKLDLANKKLEELAVKDHLTGLLNRHGLDKIGYPYFDRAMRNKLPLIIFFIDVNNMKDINDKYGHLQGDVALQTVATVIKKAVDKNGIEVRYGGDEFIIISSFIDRESTSELQKRLTAAIENEARDMCLPYDLSASVGYVVANPSENQTLDEYIKIADGKMYDIKKEMHKKLNY